MSVFLWQLSGELMVQEERVAKEVEREGKVVKAVKVERAVEGEGEGEDGVEAEEDKFLQVY